MTSELYLEEFLHQNFVSRYLSLFHNIGKILIFAKTNLHSQLIKSTDEFVILLKANLKASINRICTQNRFKTFVETEKCQKSFEGPGLGKLKLQITVECGTMGGRRRVDCFLKNIVVIGWGY